MKQSLEKEERELEEKRLIFLKEKQLWEDSNKEEEDRLRLSLEKEYEPHSIYSYKFLVKLIFLFSSKELIRKRRRFSNVNSSTRQPASCLL